MKFIAVCHPGICMRVNMPFAPYKELFFQLSAFQYERRKKEEEYFQFRIIRRYFQSVMHVGSRMAQNWHI